MPQRLYKLFSRIDARASISGGKIHHHLIDPAQRQALEDIVSKGTHVAARLVNTLILPNGGSGRVGPCGCGRPVGSALEQIEPGRSPLDCMEPQPSSLKA